MMTPSVTTDEPIAKGLKRAVKYLVEEKEVGVDEEVVVRAPRIKKESVQTVIRTEEARRVRPPCRDAAGNHRGFGRAELS